MILGIGTDIIGIERVRKAIADNDFRKAAYSERELEYCEKNSNGERFAGRFAAKEAFFKAIGTGWTDPTQLQEVEILNNEKGKPGIILSGSTLEVFNKIGAAVIHISISHSKEIAVAFVVIEG
jgi:holo-[acyl-carrier protein] synthase